MSTTTTQGPPVEHLSSTPQPAVRIDQQTIRVLRMLGEAALRLADGNEVDWASFDHSAFSATGLSSSSQLLTVPEACARLRVSRWMFYRLIQQKQLTTITVGRRRLVPAEEVERFVKMSRGESQ